MDSSPNHMPLKLQLILAAACCFILANIYYAQPIIAGIAADIGLETSASGLIVTLAQIGYCSGVILLVPLGDVIDNRKLICFLVSAAALALLGVALSQGKLSFMGAMLLLGLCSCAVQIIIPLSVNLAADNERGRVVGLIMSGAILGIVLARPWSSWLTGLYSWQLVYFCAAGLMALTAVVLFNCLPSTVSAKGRLDYPAMLQSMWRLMASTQGLKPRLMVMALVFMSFTMFWAAAPMVLQAELKLSHPNIALYSLASLAAPPFALMGGYFIDRGKSYITSIFSLLMIGLGFLITPVFGIWVLIFVLAVILIDPGVHMTNVVMQQAVLTMIPQARSRLNALCIAFTFTGGAIGSSLGPWLYSHFGWPLTSLTGFSLVVAAMVTNVALVGRR